MPELRRCPWSQIDNEVWELVRWGQQYESLKVLPWGGSDLMSQPGFVLEVVEMYFSAKAETEANQAEKQRVELESAQRKAKSAQGVKSRGR